MSDASLTDRLVALERERAGLRTQLRATQLLALVGLAAAAGAWLQGSEGGGGELRVSALEIADADRRIRLTPGQLVIGDDDSHAKLDADSLLLQKGPARSEVYAWGALHLESEGGVIDAAAEPGAGRLMLAVSDENGKRQAVVKLAAENDDDGGRSGVTVFSAEDAARVDLRAEADAPPEIEVAWRGGDSRTLRARRGGDGAAPQR